MSQEETEDLARLLNITFLEAEKLMLETNVDINETGLIVKELSTVAERWDKSRSVKLKRPKGQKGMTAPVTCGYCGSAYKQEVKK